MNRSAIEVFKTNIRQEKHARHITALLQGRFPGTKANFDLEDCDNILRVEAHNLNVTDIIDLLQQQGFSCHVLE